MELIKKTSLETSTDVVSTLKWKLERLQEEERDPGTGLADYIYLATDSIAAQLEELKSLKKQILDREKQLKEQDTSIKEGTADFLLSMGLDKLDGNLVSSITISKGKPATTKQKFVSNISKKEIEELVVKSGMGYYEEVEVPATPDVVRVNKRKIALSEVVEDADSHH